MIKKMTFLLLLGFIGLNSVAQTQTEEAQKMKLVGNKIFLGDRPLSVIDARDLSVTLPEAYLYFNRAKRIRDWNYFWGGYLGLTALSSNSLSPNQNPTYGVFGLLIGIIVVPRELRRQKLIIKGIEAYNKKHL
ncbi:MAG: hypothetical protein RJA92_901 [Bacteroidota bacterium]|jgi:hypothetical protein